MVIACWYLIGLRIFYFLPFGGQVVFVIDQISKWGLLMGLSYLFFASSPDWLKNELQRVFAFRRHKPA
jgi:hypothetical protein